MAKLDEPMTMVCEKLKIYLIKHLFIKYKDNMTKLSVYDQGKIY